LRKARSVIDRHFGKHFPVYDDSRLLETVHQLAVTYAVDARRGIYSGDPQLSEVSFVIFSIPVCINLRSHDRLVSDPKLPAFGAEISLSKFQNPFMSFTGPYTAFNSGHFLFLPPIYTESSVLLSIHLRLTHTFPSYDACAPFLPLI